LSSLTAIQLGSIAIKGALSRAGIDANEVEEVFMGNVLSAGLGQGPARQAALMAGINATTPCTTVNKVCSSGLKAISLGVNQIRLGYADVVVAGGMESMSNVPYYMPLARQGYRLGHGQLVDGLLKDGLWDPFHNCQMGEAGELCAAKFNLSRNDQDEYSINSYKKAEEANKLGYFANEIIPVEIVTKNNEVITITQDEEFKKFDETKLRKLRPVFRPDGTVTAANASSLSDGAAAVVLMSEQKAKSLGVPILAKILGYGDAAQEPLEFTTSPNLAARKALNEAKLSISDIDYFEINEAFSVVGLANIKLLGLDKNFVNVFGGSVGLGHPLGCSGARIVTTLISVLQTNTKRYGCAAVCNGGGGASAIVIENVTKKNGKHLD